MSKVTFEINGKPVEAEQGQMIIEVADENNIRIPRFCYHKKLSIAANCRMCLVQVEKAPKPLPACATPITEGMKVYTRSAMALESQRIVMEFLLINHPLDCPVCDQGGECELQDVSMGYGEGLSEYTEGKRSVDDPDLGPLVATYMTRCIQCTRCVRFGDEISGIRELGAVGRGEFMKITTFVKKNVESELSGNIIDICPVGALTNKPFQFKARPWELNQRAMIGAHDCVGSHLFVHERRNEVMRAVPRESEHINEVWMSDRDRYAIHGIATPDRLTKPEIKINGVWQSTDWASALEHTVNALQKVLHEDGAEAVGALVSPSETLENMYMMQSFMRGLGVANIDHRLKVQDFSDEAAFPLYPHLGMTIGELEEADVIMLVGSHLRKEQPMLWHRAYKATRHGAKVIVVDLMHHDTNLPGSVSFVADRGDLLSALSQASREAADVLKSGEKVAILLGAQALHHPHAAHIRHAAHALAKQYNAHFGLLTEGANAAGAWVSGCVPHRGPGGQSVTVGKNAMQMFEQPCKAYVLLNVEPPLDCAYGASVKKSLRAADAVVCVTTHANPAMREYATVLLPATPFTEMSGSFVNAQGDEQSFSAAVLPNGEARPAWKIFRALADLNRLENMSFDTLEDVQADLHKFVGAKNICPSHDWEAPKHSPKSWNGLIRIAETPIYAVDMLTRRSEPLQATDDMKWVQGVQVSQSLFDSLGMKEGELVLVSQEDAQAHLPLVLNKRLPEHSVFIAYGLQAQTTLGAGFAEIKVGGGQ